jgi:hypothetical protein
MRGLAWCVGVLSLTVVATAKTQAPRADEPNLSAMGMSIHANYMERSGPDRLIAKNGVEASVGNVAISSKEATFQWSADKHSVEIHPTGEVIVRVTELANPK